MRGHWIGGTRKLNRHWQSGGGSAEFSRWFTTIKYDDDYYCFAPSYQFETLNPITYAEYDPTTIRHEVIPSLKGTWTSFGQRKLIPSANNNMDFVISYTLEDVRENGVITTRTLSPSDRVKVICPTFEVSMYVPTDDDPTPVSQRYGYRYSTTPIVPAGAEILWQTGSELSYESRYSDSLNLIRNCWNAWQSFGWPNVGGGLVNNINIDVYTDYGDIFLNDPYKKCCELRLGYYDHNTASSGVPIAQNLLAPIMRQLYTGQSVNYIVPFNSVQYMTTETFWIKISLVKLDLEERVIV